MREVLRQMRGPSVLAAALEVHEAEDERVVVVERKGCACCSIM